MEASAISALAALFGSLVGGLTTLATSWLGHRVSTRTERARIEITKREALYGEYIEEASARTIHALEHELTDANAMVRLYGLYCRIQLVSTRPVVEAAELVLRKTGETYITPNVAPGEVIRGALGEVVGGKAVLALENTPVVVFSRACREELEALQRAL
jgi:hypothetical protein